MKSELIQVIRTITCIGEGKPDNPHREVAYYFAPNGEMLAMGDSWQEQEDGRILREHASRGEELKHWRNRTDEAESQARKMEHQAEVLTIKVGCLEAHISKLKARMKKADLKIGMKRNRKP
jgi:hypothetical protein